LSCVQNKHIEFFFFALSSTTPSSVFCWHLKNHNMHGWVVIDINMGAPSSVFLWHLVCMVFSQRV
jgi:hypothetical protein